eukprot:g1312.t1
MSSSSWKQLHEKYVTMSDLPRIRSVLKPDGKTSVLKNASQTSNKTAVPGKRFTCRVCGLSFESSKEQRAHFKSDAHVQCLRDRKHGIATPPVVPTREKGDATVSSSSLIVSPDSVSIKGTLERLGDGDVIGVSVRHCRRVPKIVFRLRIKERTATDLPGNKVEDVYDVRLTMWRALVTDTKRSSTSLIPQMILPVLQSKDAAWCVLLLRSGDFAGAIFDNKSQRPICHKTIHRYTTRRKQGGSQSKRDNSGGAKPRSAGAKLRRYNEVEFAREVRALLCEDPAWVSALDRCNLVFVSRPRELGAILFDNAGSAKAAPFARGDPRLRRVPIMVQRPTFKEVTRVYTTLLMSKVSICRPDDDDEEVGGKGGSEDGEQGQDDDVGKSRMSKVKDGTIVVTEATGISTTTNTVDASSSSSKERDVDGVVLSTSSDSVDAFESNFCTVCLEMLGSDDDGVVSTESVAKCCGDARSKEDDSSGKFAPKKRDNAKSPTVDRSQQKRKGEVPNVYQLPCRHRFHTRCIVPWLLEYASCPICRTDALAIDVGVPDTDLYQACEAGDLDAAKSALDSYAEDLPVSVDTFMSLRCGTRGLTSLHAASMNGHQPVVDWLLESGASPCVRDFRNRAPYYLAKNKAMRNAFRRYRGRCPEKWDYGEASIPDALTEEMEQQRRKRGQRKREKRRRARKKKGEKAKTCDDNLAISSSSTASHANASSSSDESKTAVSNDGTWSFLRDDHFEAAARAQRWRKLARSLGIRDEDALMLAALKGGGDSHTVLQSAEFALEAGIPVEDVLASLQLNDDDDDDDDCGGGDTERRQEETSSSKTLRSETCVACSKAISRDDALRKNGFVYCDQPCIRRHRRDLAASAAESRQRARGA